LCALGGLYLKTFILPEREDLSDLQRQMDKLMKELNDSKAITRDLQAYKDQVKKLDEELTHALKQLPNEKEIPEILKNISSLGKESQLEFVLFRPKPEEPQQFYAKVPIELILVGTYHHTGTFFDKVSKLPRIINVVDFNMARAKEASRATEEVLVRVSCMVNTYRFIEKKGEEKKGEKKPVSTEGEEELLPKAKK
ncbi:MAG TPA: type 4a pilus biogenesis protein PilO, partial [Thermodesulfobacteriota bacterium]|nr:type 4a pilus biogenesis protein PilO [Thermodesulfobacteriota bacterium]